MLKKLIRLVRDNPYFWPLLLLVDLLFLVVDSLAQLGSRELQPNSLALVKLDKLGDYILMRNFIPELRKSEKYRNYRFTFIGNIENKAFVSYLDKEVWDDILWIDIYKYSSNLRYRYAISKQIYRAGFDVCICPTYARLLVLDDFVARNTKARVRIGQTPHLINMKKWEAAFGNRQYHVLIKASTNIIFEFERNKIFFTHISGTTFQDIALQIDMKVAVNTQNPYAVFLPGAAVPQRCWPTDNYAQLADKMAKQFGLDIILCGAPSEYIFGQKICIASMHIEKITNNIGKYDVQQFLKILAGATIIVSNETAAVHISAALNKKTICITNGNHYLSFTEFPAEMGKDIHYIYPPGIDLSAANQQETAKQFEIHKHLNIHAITTQNVLQKVAEIF